MENREKQNRTETEQPENREEDDIFSKREKEQIEKLSQIDATISNLENQEERETKEKEKKDTLSIAVDRIKKSPYGEVLLNLVKPGDKENVELLNSEDFQQKREEVKREKELIEERIKKFEDINDGVTREVERGNIEKLKKEKEEINKKEKKLEEKEKNLRESFTRKENFLNWMTDENNENISKNVAQMIYGEAYKQKVFAIEKERKKSDSNLIKEEKASYNEGRFHVSGKDLEKEMEQDLEEKEFRENPSVGRKVRIEIEPGKLEEGWEIISIHGDVIEVGRRDHRKTEKAYKKKKEVTFENLLEWNFGDSEDNFEIIPDDSKEEIERLNEEKTEQLKTEGELIKEGAEYEDYDGRKFLKITSEQHKQVEREMKADKTLWGKSKKFTGKTIGFFLKTVWSLIKTVPFLISAGWYFVQDRIAKGTGVEKKDK